MMCLLEQFLLQAVLECDRHIVLQVVDEWLVEIETGGGIDLENEESKMVLVRIDGDHPHVWLCGQIALEIWCCWENGTWVAAPA